MTPDGLGHSCHRAAGSLRRMRIWLQKMAGAVVLLGLGVVLKPSLALWIAIVVAASVWVLLSAPTARFLPSISIERGDGFALRFRSPELAGRRRLKKDALELVAGIRRYVNSSPAPLTASMQQHFENMQAMTAVATPEEKNAVWNAYVASSSERSEREAHELAARFGGDIAHVVGEFQRQGMLTEQAAQKVEWEARSVHWITRAANTIEGLARKL